MLGELANGTGVYILCDKGVRAADHPRAVTFIVCLVTSTTASAVKVIRRETAYDLSCFATQSPIIIIIIIAPVIVVLYRLPFILFGRRTACDMNTWYN